MLNEIKEYEQYTFTEFPPDDYSFESFNPDDFFPEKKSLKYRMLVGNSFSGIEQAMVTIARHFLFDDSGKYTESSIKKAENALRLWCGGKDDCLDETTEVLRNWLLDYIKKVLLRERILLFESQNNQASSVVLNLPSEWVEKIKELAEIDPSEQTLEELQDTAKTLKGFRDKKSDSYSMYLRYKDDYEKYIAPIYRAINAINKPPKVSKAKDGIKKKVKIESSDKQIVNFKKKVRKFVKAYSGSDTYRFPQEYCNTVSRIKTIICEDNSEQAEKELLDLATQIEEKFKVKAVDKDMFETYLIPITKCIYAIHSLSSKRKSFANDMFQVEISKREAGKYSNDFKAITYDSVIATGCNTGALKRYYLCCDDKKHIDSVRCSKKKVLVEMASKEKDILLKTLAVWGLSQLRQSYGKQKSVPINQAVIINWLKDVSKYDDFTSILKSFQIEEGKDKYLFSLSKTGGNLSKLSVTDHAVDWIQHFSVLEESELEGDTWKKENPNGMFFRDDGAGSYLVENALYD